MGFIDGMGRLLAGKPVFVNPGSQNNMQQPMPAKATGGGKTIPVVIVSSVESHLGHDDMNCSVHVFNQSDGEVFIDKIHLLSTTKELDCNLRAGEEREFCDVFRGKRPDHTNYKSCELQYRNATGDYFKSEHNLEYKHEPDGTYSLSRVRFVPPIHDI